jgi:hypothetical protein
MSDTAKSYIRTLANTEGTERIQFVSYAAKSGWLFYVAKMVKKDEKFRVTASGARASYADIDKAKAAVDAGVKKAIEKGWVVPETKKGPGPKKDDFTLDNLPEPTKATPVETVEPEAVSEETVEVAKKSKK